MKTLLSTLALGLSLGIISCDFGNSTDEGSQQYAPDSLLGKWEVLETQPVSYKTPKYSRTIDEHIGMLELFEDNTINVEFWDWDLIDTDKEVYEDGEDRNERDYDDQFELEDRVSTWRISGDTLALDFTTEVEKHREVPENEKPIEQMYIYSLDNDTLKLFRLHKDEDAMEIAAIDANNYHYIRK